MVGLGRFVIEMRAVCANPWQHCGVRDCEHMATKQSGAQYGGNDEVHRCVKAKRERKRNGDQYDEQCRLEGPDLQCGR